MAPRIEGIIPVMLTPFTEDGEVDYPGLARLIEWYLAHGFVKPARAEIISEFGFGSLLARIVTRAQPLVIDLCCDTAGENRLAAPQQLI